MKLKFLQIGGGLVLAIFVIAGALGLALHFVGADTLSYQSHLSEENFANSKLSSYELSQAPDKIPLSADAYVVCDLDLEENILEKNENQILPIASITKLMTALVARDMLTADRQIEMTRRAWETYGNTAYLRVGDKLPLSVMLYPLLLTSSNDVAEAIAETAGREQFVARMNQLAKELGMNQTHFDDPSGLSPHNISTPVDLVKLINYIHKKEPDLLTITNLKSYRYGRFAWSNLNRVSLMKYYQGGKNGYTDEARRTLVSLFEVPVKVATGTDDKSKQENRLLAVVLLASEDNRQDTKSLLNYINRYASYVGGKNGFIPVNPSSS